MVFKGTFFAVLVALFAGLSSPVLASSVIADEADRHGRDFGENPNQAEVFGSSIQTVYGRQNHNRDSDFLTFEGFTAGTTSLDFLFTNDGDWGGFNIRIKTSAFKNKNDWYPLVYSGSFDGVNAGNPKKISYVLDNYTGPLHVAIDFYNADYRNGNGLSYTISTFQQSNTPNNNPAPAPRVPLPAGFPLAATGLAALLLVARRRTA